MDEFCDKIKIFFMGWIPDCLKSDVRIKQIPWLPVGEYLKTVAAIQPHIGLCPLEENIFNRSKSNMKWLEYTTMGAVTVASNVLPYQEVITTGVNGILVDNLRVRDWYGAVAGLINNPDQIKTMVTAAVQVMEDKQLDIRTSHVLIDTMHEIHNSVVIARERKQKKSA